MATSSVLLFPLTVFLLIAAPIFIAVIFNQPPGFDPVPFPSDKCSFGPSVTVPYHHDKVVQVMERHGDGLLPGPEDLAYDKKTGFLYTGCEDGWIRRVRVGGGEVEDWVYVGGRPLGIAFSPDGNLVVAEVLKGLMIVKPDKTVDMLVNEAEGQKFLIINGVDITSDSVIYFTDASHTHNLDTNILDFLGGRPHGRLLSFDLSTNLTAVLLRDLYFANGVAVSPDERSIIYCETPLRRCNRYHIQGDNKGTVEKFIENLPGFPDNIRYDGEGRYWIALASLRTSFSDAIFKYPILRKLLVCLAKFITIPQKGSGIMSVNLEGEPISLFSDERLLTITGGLKIENRLYFGSVVNKYIGSIVLEGDESDLTKSTY